MPTTVLIVTLRGDNMYNFADKFFNIALPRVRDFKGVSRNTTAVAAAAVIITDFEISNFEPPVSVAAAGRRTGRPPPGRG